MGTHMSRFWEKPPNTRPLGCRQESGRGEGNVTALPHDLYLAATAKNLLNTGKARLQGGRVAGTSSRCPLTGSRAGSRPFTTNPLNHWLLLEVGFRCGSPSALITVYLLDAHGSMTMQEVCEPVRHLGLASWEHRIWKLQKLRASTIDGTRHRVLPLISALISTSSHPERGRSEA